MQFQLKDSGLEFQPVGSSPSLSIGQVPIRVPSDLCNFNGNFVSSGWSRWQSPLLWRWISSPANSLLIISTGCLTGTHIQHEQKWTHHLPHKSLFSFSVLLFLNKLHHHPARCRTRNSGVIFDSSFSLTLRFHESSLEVLLKPIAFALSSQYTSWLSSPLSFFKLIKEFGCAGTQLWHMGSQLYHLGFFTVVHELLSCDSWALEHGLSCCGLRTQFFCSIQDHSSPTRYQTHIPWIARQTLNHLTTREVPVHYHLSKRVSTIASF